MNAISHLKWYIMVVFFIEILTTIFTCVPTMTVTTDMPNIWPSDHNLRAGKAIMDRFMTTLSATPSTAPPVYNPICNPTDWTYNATGGPTPCSLVWCESDPAVPPTNV